MLGEQNQSALYGVREPGAGATLMLARTTQYLATNISPHSGYQYHNLCLDTPTCLTLLARYLLLRLVMVIYA